MICTEGKEKVYVCTKTHIHMHAHICVCLACMSILLSPGFLRGSDGKEPSY